MRGGIQSNPLVSSLPSDSGQHRGWLRVDPHTYTHHEQRQSPGAHVVLARHKARSRQTNQQTLKKHHEYSS